MSIAKTISLPATHTVRRQDKYAVATIDFQKLPVNVLEAAIPVALATMLLNTYNGGGKDSTNAERQSRVDKKLDAWYRGELNVNNRGESMTTLMDAAYRTKLESQLGKISDDAYRTFKLDAIKAATGKPLGKDEKLTFAYFLECRCKVTGANHDQLLAELEAKAEELAAIKAEALAAIPADAVSF